MTLSRGGTPQGTAVIRPNFGVQTSLLQKLQNKECFKLEPRAASISSNEDGPTEFKNLRRPKPLARNLSFNTTSSLNSPLVMAGPNGAQVRPDHGLNFFKRLLDAASKK